MARDLVRSYEVVDVAPEDSNRNWDNNVADFGASLREHFKCHCFRPLINYCHMTKENQIHILGVDIGKVIITGDTDSPDRSMFGKDFLQSPEVEGAVEILKYLVSSPRWVQVYLISKCGEDMQKRTLSWLEAHDFYNRTGIARENVYFCRERSDKAGIARRLSVTYFIDDRIDVLKSMPQQVRVKILFDPDNKVKTRNDMAIARDWQEVYSILTNKNWPTTA